MSLLNFESLQPRELITQYILEIKQCGTMLPYSDYEYVDLWLDVQSGDADAVLLVLSEILPEYFGHTADGAGSEGTGDANTRKKRRSLKGIHKKVMRISREMAMRNRSAK